MDRSFWEPVSIKKEKYGGVGRKFSWEGTERKGLRRQGKVEVAEKKSGGNTVVSVSTRGGKWHGSQKGVKRPSPTGGS